MSDDVIAPQLDRCRLELRLRQVEMVLTAMRRRARYRHATLGTTPAPLRDAIVGFEIERDDLRRRLRRARGSGYSTATSSTGSP